MGNIPDTGLVAVIAECDGGRLVEDGDDLLTKVVKAVMETRKAGAVKIALKIAPTGRGSIEIRADIDATIPEHDRNGTTFFVDGEAQLVRNDPNQPKLPLAEAEVPRGVPVRVV